MRLPVNDNPAFVPQRRSTPTTISVPSQASIVVADFQSAMAIAVLEPAVWALLLAAPERLWRCDLIVET